MGLASFGRLVEGGFAYNSTSKCCFRTAERLDKRCDTIVFVVVGVRKFGDA
jgi:hypothetical protein